MKKKNEIFQEISIKFGFPQNISVHPDWIIAEKKRVELSKNIRKSSDIAPLIDHTLLKPDADVSDIFKLCDEALKFGFAGVCVNPFWVSTASKRLLGSGTMVCTVVGFPLGANTTEIKVAEAMRAIDDGAAELDLVMNIGALKSGNWDTVHADIVSVVESASPIPVKVILETALLKKDEIIVSSLLSYSAGAVFVKTSTGFSRHGATPEAVSLMSKTVGEKIGIKASGGIGDFKTAIEMIKAGATRIGSSKSTIIVR